MNEYKYNQKSIVVHTKGRGTYEITDMINDIVKESAIDQGLCNIFIHHTSALLILCENADSTVRKDLEAFMQRISPNGDPLFRHTTEGPDDMPAHVRTVLTHSELNLPIIAKRCALGTWQGIYVWEHRIHAYARNVTVTTHGIAN